MIGALTKQLVNALKVVPTGIEEAFERAEREVGGRGLQVSEVVTLLQAAFAPMKRTFFVLVPWMNVRIHIHPNSDLIAYRFPGIARRLAIYY